MCRNSLFEYVTADEAMSIIGVGRYRFKKILEKNLLKFYISPTSSRKMFYMEDLNDFLEKFRERGYGNNPSDL